ncbi:MAG: MFS transporter [Alphaproteobacteria bacterium]|nr:MFS transporter [Alphaproteobacteria bacterium]
MFRDPTFQPIREARWLGFGFVLGFSSCFGQTYFISLFTKELRTELDISHATLGSAYMLATLAGAAGLVGLGRLADKWPAGVLGGTAVVFLAAASFALAHASSLEMLLVALFGLRLFGQGMTQHIGTTAISRWYNRNRGKAVAVLGLGMPASELIMPVTAVALVELLGWRQTWLTFSIVLLVFFAPVVFALGRRDRDPSSAARPTKQIAPESAPESAPDRGTSWRLREALRHGLFYVIIAGALIPPFVLTGVFFYQVDLVGEKGWSLQLYAWSFTVYALTSLSVGFVSGWLVDRMEISRILSFCLLPMAVGLTILWRVDSIWAAPVFMALSGTTIGFASTSLVVIWPRIYGTLHLGAIKGVTLASMVVSTAIAPAVFGLALERGIEMVTLIQWSAILTGLGALMLIVARPRLKAAAGSPVR